MVQKGRELPVWKIDSSSPVKDARTAVGEKVIIPIKRSHVEGHNIGFGRDRIGDRLVVTVATCTSQFLWLPFGPFTHCDLSLSDPV